MHEEAVPPPGRRALPRADLPPSPPVPGLVDELEGEDRGREDDGEEDEGELDEARARREGLDEVVAQEPAHSSHPAAAAGQVAVVLDVARVDGDEELVRVGLLDVGEDRLQRVFRLGRGRVAQEGRREAAGAEDEGHEGVVQSRVAVVRVRVALPALARSWSRCDGRSGRRARWRRVELPRSEGARHRLAQQCRGSRSLREPRLQHGWRWW